jgi:hypothetical protein
MHAGISECRAVSCRVWVFDTKISPIPSHALAPNFLIFPEINFFISPIDDYILISHLLEQLELRKKIVSSFSSAKFCLLIHVTSLAQAPTEGNEKERTSRKFSILMPCSLISDGACVCVCLCEGTRFPQH